MMPEMRFSIPRPARRGVTLMEVLIAVGVLTIGLLGMAALIPLGKLELAAGDQFDNVSSVGRAAFRDLSVRGYLRPEMWADPITGRTVVPLSDFPNEYAVANNADTARQFPSSSSATGIKGPPFAPIIIDPLMIAPRFFQETPNANSLNDEEQAHRQRVLTFPYSTQLNGWNSEWPEATQPRMPRVTLRTVPPNMIGIKDATSFLSSTMKFDTAQRFFRATDDLSISYPPDKKLKPIQDFGVTSLSLSNLTLSVADITATTESDSFGQIAYRKFRGDYSWFLVVEPGMAEAYWSSPQSMPVVGGPASSLLTTKQYRVWTVVCLKRDLRETSNMDLAVDRDVGERCVWVDFVDRNTARLRIHDADRGTAMKVLRLKKQQWFAAIGAYNEPALGGFPRYVMEWFRILNVADEVTSAKDHDGNDTGTWYREVTIAGRDFSNMGFEFIDANIFHEYEDLTTVARSTGADVDASGHAEPLTAWGVIVEGARGVYEKTIFLDRPSSWAME